MTNGGAVTLRVKLIVVGIALGVGALHFLVGPSYRGPLPGFVNGYLIDLLLPFAMFLVTGFLRHRVLGAWPVRALAVFGAGAVAETLQLLEMPVLGRTFDPVDYLMYALGVAGGVVLERVVLTRVRVRDLT